MENFDIAKYLKEHSLGPYGMFNGYVDLKPLKEEEKETELDTVIPYEGPEHKLTGNGEGDEFEQAEAVSESSYDDAMMDLARGYLTRDEWEAKKATWDEMKYRATYSLGHEASSANDYLNKNQDPGESYEEYQNRFGE